MKLPKILTVLLLTLPAVAHAWWNEDWTQRTQITLNTTAQGVPIEQPALGVVIPVRLHSGNFDFVGAKPDGSDLRVISGDDKTPLKFWIERLDSANELAVLWVQLPTVLPASDKNVLYVYAGNEKAAAEASAPALFDAETLAAFHFAEKDGLAADQTGALKVTAAAALEVNGLIGQSASLSGTPLVWPANDKLKFAAGAPLSIALWVKPNAAQGTLYHQGALTVSLEGGALITKLGEATVRGAQVAPGTWSQIAVTLGSGKLTAYVNGASAGEGDVPASGTAIEGDLQVGENYQGLVDELQIAASPRSPEWIRLNYAAQSADARLIAATQQNATDAQPSEGGGGYFGILFKSLTPDAWVVIAILAMMFVVAVLVMVTKALYVNRTESANRRFLSNFRSVGNVLLISVEQSTAGQFDSSPLYRLYSAGVRELNKRDVGRDDRPLSSASLDAVKAAVDADSVREGYRLNAQMVLLTIAISGGPFLGLLGTVIGVMITFASIAAAGDVNVNAIAPGIAAALLATVAGLSVAIPALFGYNYLASRIKMLSSDMQIFVDEFVTRVAEAYGAR